jgi:hypothetical protein
MSLLTYRRLVAVWGGLDVNVAVKSDEIILKVPEMIGLLAPRQDSQPGTPMQIIASCIMATSRPEYGTQIRGIFSQAHQQITWIVSLNGWVCSSGSQFQHPFD